MKSWLLLLIPCEETEAEAIAKKSVTERITSLVGKITIEDFWGLEFCLQN